MSSASSNNITRFILVIGLWGCLLTVGFIGLVAGSASYERLSTAGQIVYNDAFSGFQTLALRLTPARYHLFRAGILVSIAGGLLLLAFWWRINWLSSAGSGLAGECRHGHARLRRWWYRLPNGSRRMALGVLLILVLIRVWYLVYCPLTFDELTSYDEFVRNGPRAIATFYPIPNNHILYNLLAWPFAKTGLPAHLVMRLPTLLLGTLGTAVNYALLMRLIGLRRATLIVISVSLVPLWVFYAVAGRGYFLQICLIQGCFFAAVELLRPASPYPRLSWLLFIGSSVLGLYLIPTYAFPLVALGIGLGGGFIVQRRGSNLWALALAGSIIALLAVILYVPVGTVSGWERILSNRFVAPQSTAQFLTDFLNGLNGTSIEVFAYSLNLNKLSLPVWLILAALGGLASWRYVPAGPARVMALLAWLQLATPLVLMAALRVFTLSRIVLYLTFFAYLLVVLLLGNLPWRRWRPFHRRWWVVSLAVVGSICFLLLYHGKFYIQGNEYHMTQTQQAYTWLSKQKTAGRPVRVWLNEPVCEMFFSHYAVLNPQVHLALYSTGQIQPDTASYDFLVVDNFPSVNHPGTKVWRPSNVYHSVFRNTLVTIYTPTVAAERQNRALFRASATATPALPVFD